MKLKINHIIIIFGTVFLLASCSKMLKESPKRVDASTFMANAKEVQSVINSIYGELGRDAGFGRYLSVLPECQADYCYGRGNYGTTFSTGLTTGGVAFTNDSWAVLYRAIRFANGILENIGDSPLTTEEFDRLSGETRFLRAFCYATLVKYWGAVPLFDEHNQHDFNKPRTAAHEIWEFVISEAGQAAKLLPGTPEMAGRPTKYAALLLQAESLLYVKQWDEAAAALQQIVESGEYSLVQLSTASDFDKVYSNKVSKSTEEIFYIKYNVDKGSSFTWMYFCSPNPIFNTGALGVYTDYVNNQFIVGWDPNDFRYQYSLYKQTKNGTLNSLTKTGMICLKFRDYSATTTTMDVDFPIYRYADALLYYAEAICRSKDQPDAKAMEMVNIVHRRAYGLPPNMAQSSDYKLSDFSTTDKFIELVLKERGYETIFEGKRYSDLKRNGKLAQYAVNAGRVASLSEVKDGAYWWPIPTEEFNYNKALDPVKDQNPGY